MSMDIVHAYVIYVCKCVGVCEIVCWYKWACWIVVPHTYLYIYIDIYKEREGGRYI